MRRTQFVSLFAAGAAMALPAAAQEAGAPATPPGPSAAQQATLGSWPAEKQTEFASWPAEVQAYFWTLPSPRQELFWRLRVNDRAALAAMEAPKREEAWTMLEQKLDAMSSAPPPGNASPPAPADDAAGEDPSGTDEP